MPENKTYTEDAKQFIDQLVKDGYDKKDIFTKYVTGGQKVGFPIIGKDGKPHLEKKTFK